MADCPECEYCCLIGLCCPPEEQLKALTAHFVNTIGCDDDEAQVYAQAIVDAKRKAMKA